MGKKQKQKTKQKNTDTAEGGNILGKWHVARRNVLEAFWPANDLLSLATSDGNRKYSRV